jgi:hypothetical protein
MPEGHDIADFIEQHDRAGSKFVKLCKEMPLWEPGADTEDNTGSDDTKSDGDGEADDEEHSDTEPLIKKKQSDTLVELANAANLFHTSATDAYADVVVARSQRSCGSALLRSVPPTCAPGGGFTATTISGPTSRVSK